MDVFKVDFDDRQWQAFSESLKPERLQIAARRAVRKTSAWVKTHIAREVKDRTKIPKKLIASRVKVYDKNWRDGGGGGYALKVWFGIDPVFADRIAPARQTKTGVSVGKYRFPGAFIPTKSPRYMGKVYYRTTDNRLPIMRARVEIEGEARPAFEKIKQGIEARLMELMRQELNYELSKV
ncbi:MAG: phage tail protein [Zoogloeaceae bacterium]|jgi:hypothetical protein|nr:phage tail protein [Zoogloeaceae bacterium]